MSIPLMSHLSICSITAIILIIFVAVNLFPDNNISALYLENRTTPEKARLCLESLNYLTTIFLFSDKK